MHVVLPPPRDPRTLLNSARTNPNVAPPSALDRTLTRSAGICALFALICGACGDKPGVPTQVDAVAQVAPPSVPLPPSEPVPAPAAPQAPQGKALSAPADPSAPVAGPLKVQFTLPGGVASPDATGAVAFDRPMVALGQIDEDVKLPWLAFDPPLPHRARWLDTRTLGIFPEQALPGSSRWKGTIAAGAAALDGAALAEPVSWSFSTPVITLTSFSPRNGAKAVPRDAPVVLRFDQPVDVASLKAALGVQVQALEGAAPRWRLEVPAAEVLGQRLRQLGLGTELGVPDKDLEPWGRRHAGKVALVVFASALPQLARVEVTVAAGLGAATGPVRAARTYQLAYVTHGPFRVQKVGCERGCDPESWRPVQVELTNPLEHDLDDKRLARLFRFSPPVQDLSASCWNTRCNLGGRFVPRTDYVLSVSGDLRDRFGQQLGKPVQGRLRTGGLRPRLSFRDDGHVLEAAERPHELALQVRNLPKLRLRALRVGRDAIAGVMARAGTHPSRRPPLQWGFDRDVAGSDRLDTEGRHIVDLDELSGSKGPALLQLEVEASATIDGKPQQLRVERLLQITDLHLHAKVSAQTSLIWVTSYSSGAPVPGVTIELHRQGQAAVQLGRTDASGLLSTTTSLERGQGAQPILVAVHGEDTALMELSWSNARYDNDIDDGPAPDGLRSLLYFEKDIHRPGETAHLSGILRRLSDGGLSLPRGAEVRVELFDPSQERVLERTVKLGPLGTFHLPLPLPAKARYGSWPVTVHFGSEQMYATIKVAVFRPARFEVDLGLSAKHLIHGQKVAAMLHGRWLSGGPMVGAKARLSVWGAAAQVAPEGWPDFAFGPNTWEPQSGEAHANQLHHDAKGELADDGKWQTSFVAAPIMDRSMQVHVEATVDDPNGHSTSRASAFWLHPASRLVGLRLPGSITRAGEGTWAEAVAVDPQGRASGEARFDVTVVRRQWRSVKVKRMDDEFAWETQHVDEPVARCVDLPGQVTGVVRSEADDDRPLVERAARAASRIRCDFVPTSAGYYVIEASSRDPEGRVSRASTGLYVFGPGHVAWNQGGEGGRLLVPDRARYKPGDVARVLLKNPFPGATAIVTEERGGVLASRVIQVPDSTLELRVPIEARHQPNVFVSAVLFRGRLKAGVKAGLDTAAPAWRMATVELPVQVDDRALKVTVKPSGLRWRPRDEVEVALQVQDAAGAGRAGEATVMVVDEGVLALTAYRTPDPHALFHGRIGLGVRNYAKAHALIRLPASEDKGEPGGGGEDEPGNFARGDLRDVAWFAAGVPVDPAGKATVRFKLPDGLTAFRVMAVVVSGTDRFGAGDARIEVARPLMVLPSMPRFVQRHDRFELAATVRNTTSRLLVGSASVALEPEGMLVPAKGLSAPFRLEPGAAAEVALRFTASGLGQVKVQWKAAASDVGDAVNLTLPIVERRPVETVAAHGVLGDGEQDLATEGLQRPEGAFEAPGGLQVRLASTGADGLQEGIEYLETYPYGCAEQTASRLLAALYAADLGKRFGALDAGRAAALEGDIGAAIDKLLSMRDVWPRGLFSTWPGGSQGSPLATAWALYVLKEARDRGRDIDKYVFESGAKALRQALENKREKQWGGRHMFDPARALMLATLARLGSPAPGYVAELYKRRSELPAFGRILLADAILRGGGPGAHAKAAAELDVLTSQMKVEGSYAHLPEQEGYGWLWSSPERTNAMALDLMVRLDPAHPMAPRLARWLVTSRRRGHWGSTQSNAWALLGLGRWFAEVEKDVPAMDFGVFLGGRSLLEGRFEGRSLAGREVHVDQADLKPGATVPLQVSRRGKGALYYAMRYRYATPATADAARNAGLLVRRTVFDLKGHTDRKTFERGEYVLVALEVMSGQSRRWVAISDPLPAGFESVDFGLATASKAVRAGFAALQRGTAVGTDSEQDWQSDERGDHREMTPQEARIFVDHLPPGRHTYTYVARATTRGGFAWPGTQAHEMYDPEVFGRAAATGVEVR